MRSLLTLPGSFGILPLEPNNSSEKVRQHLERGSFFDVRTLEKYGVFSVISGRESANRIPCKGEYAGRSLTVVSSRPFLRPAEGQLTKSERSPMFHIITTSRTTRAIHRFQSLAERSASILALAAVFFMALMGVTA